ncbi:hypothetical protein K492DRAFT_205034 [Lichtheimia hyalospora FSU 10163]|nr:hypothetical protein K492DRAFT_205034 [Lichtheimia hyalospora FSU 10163]
MTLSTHHKRQSSIYDSLPMLEAWNKAAIPNQNFTYTPSTKRKQRPTNRAVSFSTDPPCVHHLQQEHTDIPGSPHMQRKHSVKSIMMHLISKNERR